VRDRKVRQPNMERSAQEGDVGKEREHRNHPNCCGFSSRVNVSSRHEHRHRHRRSSHDIQKSTARPLSCARHPGPKLQRT
jgi:hypothetical protein